MRPAFAREQCARNPGRFAGKVVAAGLRWGIADAVLALLIDEHTLRRHPSPARSNPCTRPPQLTTASHNPVRQARRDEQPRRLRLNRPARDRLDVRDLRVKLEFDGEPQHAVAEVQRRSIDHTEALRGVCAAAATAFAIDYGRSSFSFSSP